MNHKHWTKSVETRVVVVVVWLSSFIQLALSVDVTTGNYVKDNDSPESDYGSKQMQEYANSKAKYFKTNTAQLLQLLSVIKTIRFLVSWSYKC